MATNEEIIDKIDGYLAQAYGRVETYGVPKNNDLTFGNTVKIMKHTKVFYIDMRKSRKILSDATGFWSVKIHKAFLRAVTHCIERRDGHLRSFNGDGILAFFVGDNASSRAVRTALEVKGFVDKINGILDKHKKSHIDFGIGIAQGEVLVAKSGKGGDNQTKQDLIWVGLPVYVALELSEIGKKPNNIWITHNVRTSIGIENHLDIVTNDNGNSIWTMEDRVLKSVGNYDVRTTTWRVPA